MKGSDPNPFDHPERWENLVGRIVNEAEPILARRRARAAVFATLAQWGPGLLAAAAVAVLILVPATVQVIGTERSSADTQSSVATTLMPDTYAAWVMADYEPTVTELMTAIEEIP